MKWKSKQSGQIIEVLGDDVENGRKYRFFTWDDDPKQIVCQWDLVYSDISWEDAFEQVR